MNTETGQIREFAPNEAPDPKEHWVELKVGEIVSLNGCYFRIHRINPAANQVILVGVERPPSTI